MNLTRKSSLEGNSPFFSGTRDAFSKGKSKLEVNIFSAVNNGLEIRKKSSLMV